MAGVASLLWIKEEEAPSWLNVMLPASRVLSFVVACCALPAIPLPVASLSAVPTSWLRFYSSWPASAALLSVLVPSFGFGWMASELDSSVAGRLASRLRIGGSSLPSLGRPS